MWGQPLSAVRASEACLGFAGAIPNVELLLILRLQKPNGNNSLALPCKRQRSFAPPDSRGRLSPHKTFPLLCLRRSTRRQLPHLQCDDKPHFLTFCTDHRWILPEHVRLAVFECCLHDNRAKFNLRVAVVMPDHVHMIFTPLINFEAMEVWSLAEIMDAIKGASAHKINKALRRKRRVWQPESFDHVLRSSESLDAKIQYLLDNPVRRGLVRDWQDYPWVWKKPFVNPFAC
jgi:REP element-mobilizing transposase RayT